jgi:hypothetical protein
VAGGIWFSLAVAFVLALICAANRGIPPVPNPENPREDMLSDPPLETRMAEESVLTATVADS